MRIKDDKVRLAPTDLSNFLSCHHLTALDLRVAEGRLERPAPYSAMIEELRKKGEAHEEAYLAHLIAAGLSVQEIPEGSDRQATIDAMKSGVEVIYQAPLGDNTWFGFADFLVKVPMQSDLGEWSYEVQDTKLAKETRGTTILQLCVYSYLVQQIQGVLPERMHVISPGKNWLPEEHRCDAYGAYFRLISKGIGEFLQSAVTTYPELVSHCDLCSFRDVCEKRRRDDDHLCYVAGMGTAQIDVLREMGLNTLTGLAAAETLPKPDRGRHETLLRLREQARIQLKKKETGNPEYVLKEPFDSEHGFANLPEPTGEDIFLDFEGDHFAEDSVQEYLTGYCTYLEDGSLSYTALWADTRAKEKAAFVTFVEFALEVRRRNPRAHIYHFAPYEPSALKRLAQNYSTHSIELDELLRGEAFVDLHQIVKRSLYASVENYSIKNLEEHFGYVRKQNLPQASRSRRAIECALELGPLEEDTNQHQEIVEAYNRDDCESTQRLQMWLEELRAEAVSTGVVIDRPPLVDPNADEKISALDRELAGLRIQLLQGVPEEPGDRTEEDHARALLAHMVEFHRREEKAAYWENFRLRDLPIEDYETERRAVVGLEFIEAIGAPKDRWQRYQFPEQDIDIRAGDSIKNRAGNTVASVKEVHLSTRQIDVQKGTKTVDEHPTDAYLHTMVRPGAVLKSLMRVAEHIIAHGFQVVAPYRSTLNLLLKNPPLCIDPAALDNSSDLVKLASAWVKQLDGDVLAIQGPPGTGKTHTGAEMICDLVAAGMSVGVTAVSHKVILNLIEKAAKQASERGMDFDAVAKPKQGTDPYSGSWNIEYTQSEPKLKKGLEGGSLKVVGGTAWLWAKPEFEQSVDVLIVDEAGQMALSNVLSLSPAGKSLVLLGDPQQLEQPIQASHPEGSDVAALRHWLGSHPTMPKSAGLFLDATWRLHPDICSFTSEVFYENRLESKPGLEKQALRSESRFSGSGLRYCAVEHVGNTARALQEVDAIKKIVAELTNGGVIWIDEIGVERELTHDDLLIVAPYNAQVASLRTEIPSLSERIGTVDKFQGQEAPVVIYSMTASSPQDAPHGMEFLYNSNRFNVATSRARAMCILVGTPSLFEPNCKSPGQMKMANGFCRYKELALRG